MRKTQVGTIYHSEKNGEHNITTEVRPANGKKFTLAELQSFVGGLVEIVPMRPGNGHATMYINEEGKLLSMDYNPNATRRARLYGGDYIVGPAVVVRTEVRP